MISDNKFLGNLSENQKGLVARIFSLTLGRALKRVYSLFDEKTKEEMSRIFASNDETEKEDFVKEKMPDFQNIFNEETKKIEEEIRLEIREQM